MIPPHPPDAELVVRIAAGDRGAFEALYERYAPRIMAFVHHLLADRTAAEDATQETFVNVWRSARSFRPDAPFEPWLFRIARHEAYDATRRRRPRAVGGPASGAVEGPGREARRAFVRLAVATGVLWGLAMAWYAPVVASRRLLFPVFPILGTAAVIVACDRLRAAGGRAAAALRACGDLAVVAATPLAAIVVGVALFAAGPAVPAGPRATFDPASLEAVAALRALPAGSRVVVRPSRTAPPDWLFDDVVEPIGLPAAVRGDGLAAWLAANADAILVGDGLWRNRPDLAPGLRQRPDGTFERTAAARRGDVLAGGRYALLFIE